VTAQNHQRYCNVLKFTTSQRPFRTNNGTNTAASLEYGIECGVNTSGQGANASARRVTISVGTSDIPVSLGAVRLAMSVLPSSSGDQEVSPVEEPPKPPVQLGETQRSFDPECLVVMDVPGGGSPILNPLLARQLKNHQAEGVKFICSHIFKVVLVAPAAKEGLS
jgi:hypothetical protein